MIEFQQVTKSYGVDRHALQNVSFQLPAGSISFLTGHSGAGKSTLLKLIAALEIPTSGEVKVGPFLISKIKKRQIPQLRQQMGIVFQDNQLLFDRTVYDNVALPLVISRYKRRDIRARVGAALERVGLAERAADNPINLSGGEQQRIGIARAVVNRPSLLIADEPTGNLDADMSQEIIKLFQLFNESGVTVLIATHDHSLLQRYAYNRLSLSGGRLVSAKTVQDNPASVQDTQARQFNHEEPA